MADSIDCAGTGAAVAAADALGCDEAAGFDAALSATPTVTVAPAGFNAAAACLAFIACLCALFAWNAWKAATSDESCPPSISSCLGAAAVLMARQAPRPW